MREIREELEDLAKSRVYTDFKSHTTNAVYLSRLLEKLSEIKTRYLNGNGPESQRANWISLSIAYEIERIMPELTLFYPISRYLPTDEKEMEMLLISFPDLYSRFQDSKGLKAKTTSLNNGEERRNRDSRNGVDSKVF